MSKQLVIKSAELVIPPLQGELDIRSVLHTLPLSKGWVFGLFTLEHKQDIARERVAHILKSHLEHLAADLVEETNVVRRFEQALSRINRDLTRAAQDLSIQLDKFNAVIGVVSRGQIFMSGLGRLKAIFLHKTADRRYVIYELDTQFQDNLEKTWDKPLVAVLDGELNPGDIFYLATPISHQVLGMNELQDILVTLPPAGALQRIRQFLPATEHFGGIAFQALEDDKTGVVRKANPIMSLQELENTKEQTASVLSDQPPDFAHTLTSITAHLSQRLASPGMRGAQVTLKRGLSLAIRSLAGLAKIIVAGVSKLSQALRRYLTESKTGSPRRLDLSNVRARLKAGSQLAATRKLALLGCLALLVILSGMLFLNNAESDKTKADAAFVTAVKTIENNILAAEASLIYRNNSEAERTLTAAAAALETLPRDTNEHINQVTILAEKLAVLQAKIRGITIIEPSLIADLRSFEQNASLLSATGTINGLIALGDNLSVYKLDVSGRNWVKQETVNGPISRIKSSTTFGSDVVVVDATQQLGRVDLAALTLNPITSGTNNMASVEDITVYNDVLYALTSASQQIVKMRPQAPNFEGGTAWISVRTSDLSTARALAIDSDIYVLLANNIIKFTSGREQAWQPATITPSLTQPVDLWTAFESKYLYILDPLENRIVVIVKDTGAVQAQYLNEAFANAVGFVVEEATSKITVVTDTQALEFTPTHLIQ